MYLPQINSAREHGERKGSSSLISSVQSPNNGAATSRRGKSKRRRNKMKKVRTLSSLQKEMDSGKRLTAKKNLNLAYKTLISHRATTSDTAFRFWH